MKLFAFSVEKTSSDAGGDWTGSGRGQGLLCWASACPIEVRMADMQPLMLLMGMLFRGLHDIW